MRAIEIIRSLGIFSTIETAWRMIKSATHRHDWEYGTMSEYIQFRVGEQIEISSKTRYCRKCNTKEKKWLGNTWHPANLTKEEERDKKLKDLGI